MTMTLNITSRAKTTMSGMMSALRDVRIHLESFGEAPISSLEAKSMIRKIAMIAPPTPNPMGMVIDMALEAAVVLVVAVVVAVVMTVDSIFPRSLDAATSFI